MADRKISELSSLAAGSQATGDLLTIVDVSEAAAADKNKKITVESLFKGIPSNVGIGTSSPAGILELSSSSTPQLFISNTSDSINSGDAVGTFDFRAGSSNTVVTRMGATADSTAEDGAHIVFETRTGGGTLSEKLRIDSSGRVGVGATDVNAPFEVRNSSALQIRTSTGTGNYWEFGRDNSTGDFFLADDSLGTVVAVDQITGNVGLGTTSPTGYIHIEGESTGTETYGRFTTGPANGDQSLVIKSGSARDHMAIQVATNAGANDDLSLQPDGGNVGLGTTSPAGTLDVSGNARIGAGAGGNFENAGTRLLVANTGGDAYIQIQAADSTGTSGLKFGRNSAANRAGIDWSASTDALQFRTGGTSDRCRLDSSGPLLVGASSSADQNAKIQVGTTGLEVFEGFNYTDTSAGAILRLAKSRATSIGSQTIVESDDELGRISFLGTDGSVYRNAAVISAEVDGTPGSSDMPGRIVFKTTPDGSSSPSERMRIASNGLHRMLSSGQPTLEVRNTSSSASSTLMQCAGGVTNMETGGSVVMKVLCDGDVENTNNRYTGISDIKLKENIVDANSQWDDIKALQVRNYNFKEELGYGTNTHIGLVAQEVELICPGLVGETNDTDAENNETGTVTKSVAYSVLYMKAVKALQEAMDRIETLEAKVAALEAQ